ncbi:type IV toxin-antitoxin system AbiEi family antitoxin domain-containing protein [Rhodococcus sp. T7]|uniref:type IV toxin-antitoxin system AbiEi family antitoxin domain-containing protein n=1 Tax=Rhodococcus sp. T7 TaxID=627444 RepID=UPI00135C5300|nr:type IV toxin-antitoxin system AbiEi family antitoxin domain-containing protein [Rhodococcus sp. T7]
MKSALFGCVLSACVRTVASMTPATIDFKPEFQTVLDHQHGLVTARQLRGLGISTRQIQHMVESGQWSAVLHGVYAVTNGPLDRPMMLWAALLFGGPRAILSHRTAAEEWSLVPVDPEGRIDVTVPYGLSAEPQGPTYRKVGRRSDRLVPREGDLLHPGVVVHRSRAHAHILVPTLLPRTSLADTVVDLAVEEPSARGAARVLVAAVTGSSASVHTLLRRIEQRPPRRYRKALTDALTFVSSGVQSMLEHRYAVDVELAHGLPAARRQSPVLVDGKTLYEDVDYSDSGVPLLVRLDGLRYHSSRSVALRDRRRGNAAELAGKATLVYGWEEVTRRSCEVADEVRTVLERGGWSGSNPCPHCREYLLTAGG